MSDSRIRPTLQCSCFLIVACQFEPVFWLRQCLLYQAALILFATMLWLVGSLLPRLALCNTYCPKHSAHQHNRTTGQLFYTTTLTADNLARHPALFHTSIPPCIGHQVFLGRLIFYTKQRLVYSLAPHRVPFHTSIPKNIVNRHFPGRHLFETKPKLAYSLALRLALCNTSCPKKFGQKDRLLWQASSMCGRLGHNCRHAQHSKPPDTAIWCPPWQAQPLPAAMLSMPPLPAG